MPGRNSDNGSEAGETGTFQTHRDEGEFYVKNKHFEKAIGSFNKAIELNQEDIGCLISRAKCWLQLGNAGNALIDAETALSKDKSVVRGLCIKAESLYQMGDFENALVFFHRGFKERPEVEDFRLGIQKAKEAITNSIGSPDSVKLEATGDLSLFYKQEESKKSQQKGTYSKPGQKKETKKERECPKSTADSKTIKQLLGALYGDKEYLERLLKDESLTSNQTPMGGEIKGHVCDGLEFLNNRADFWRQQKPMYARKRDKERMRRGYKNKSQDPTNHILKCLEDIDEAQTRGKYEESLRKATKTLQYVENIPDDEIQNKQDVLANLHSQIGNAYLEMGKFRQALDHHHIDKDIAEANDLENAKSRALDNLGRVHARKGDYEKAVDVWLVKLPLSKSPLEKTWLFHEIGRCYLELGKYTDAREHGEKSLAAAKEAEDEGWQLHASVLIAQSEVKCGDLQAAAESFERSLDMAKKINDSAAENAIKKALEEVNDKIVKGVKDGDEQEDDRASNKSREGRESRQSGKESPKYDDDFEDDKEYDTDYMHGLSSEPCSVFSRSSSDADYDMVERLAVINEMHTRNRSASMRICEKQLSESRNTKSAESFYELSRETSLTEMQKLENGKGKEPEANSKVTKTLTNMTAALETSLDPSTETNTTEYNKDKQPGVNTSNPKFKEKVNENVQEQNLTKVEMGSQEQTEQGCVTKNTQDDVNNERKRSKSSLRKKCSTGSGGAAKVQQESQTSESVRKMSDRQKSVDFVSIENSPENNLGRSENEKGIEISDTNDISQDINKKSPDQKQTRDESTSPTQTSDNQSEIYNESTESNKCDKSDGAARAKSTESKKSDESGGATRAKSTESKKSDKSDDPARAKSTESKRSDKSGGAARAKSTESKKSDKSDGAARAKSTESKKSDKSDGAARAKSTESKKSDKSGGAARAKSTESKRSDKLDGATRVKSTESKKSDKSDGDTRAKSTESKKSDKLDGAARAKSTESKKFDKTNGAARAKSNESNISDKSDDSARAKSTASKRSGKSDGAARTKSTESKRSDKSDDVTRAKSIESKKSDKSDGAARAKSTEANISDKSDAAAIARSTESKKSIESRTPARVKSTQSNRSNKSEGAARTPSSQSNASFVSDGSAIAKSTEVTRSEAKPRVNSTESVPSEIDESPSKLLEQQALCGESVCMENSDKIKNRDSDIVQKSSQEHIKSTKEMDDDKKINSDLPQSETLNSSGESDVACVNIVKAVKSRTSIASGGQLRGSTTSPVKRSARETREEMSARASRDASASRASQGRTSARESRKGSEHKVVVEQDDRDNTKQQTEGDDKQDKQSTGGSDAGDQDKERKGSGHAKGRKGSGHGHAKGRKDSAKQEDED